jgi:fructokinase
MPPSALVFGEALVDCFEDGPVVGGAPLNFAVHLHRRGWGVRLVSRVGEDAHGGRIVELLEREGVSLADLQRESGATGWVSVETDDAGEPRYVIHADVAWDRIEPPRAPAGDLLYFNTLAARAPGSASTLEGLLARSFRHRVFDVNLRQDYWSRSLVLEGVARATLVKLNHEELARLELAPEALLEGHPELEVVCVTHGGEGAALHLQGGRKVVEVAPEVSVVDTVGAGDALCAALVDGLVRRGEPPEQALSGAISFAAEVVQVRGALPTPP